MSVITEEGLDETILPIQKTDLIYQIEDRPPFKEALFILTPFLIHFIQSVVKIEY